jgi:hypothetical protein
MKLELVFEGLEDAYTGRVGTYGSMSKGRERVSDPGHQSTPNVEHAEADGASDQLGMSP